MRVPKAREIPTVIRSTALAALVPILVKALPLPQVMAMLGSKRKASAPASDVHELGRIAAGVVKRAPRFGVGECLVRSLVLYNLLRRARAPAYVAFDILWLDGTDLRSLPLGERRKRLQAILPTKSPIIAEALSVTGRGRELFELMRSNDLEGIVAKRLDDPYEPRVRWLKIKNGDYSQTEGRGDLFNGPRQRRADSASWR